MSLEAKKLELDATISEHVRVTGRCPHVMSSVKVDLAAEARISMQGHGGRWTWPGRRVRSS